MKYSLKSLFMSLLFFVLIFPLSAFSEECPENSSPPTKAAWAGQMVWVKGDVHAQLPSQTSRALERRSPLYETDTITTGTNGAGQIVFSDESTLALRADTSLKIEQYAYNKNAKSSKQKLVINLVKGGFRTITGLVAKKNPNGYSIKTPVATIGVRGTVFSVIYNFGTGVLKTAVWAGSLIVANQGGTLTLTPEARQFAEVVSSIQIPSPLKTIPEFDTHHEPVLQQDVKATPPAVGGATCVTIGGGGSA